MSVTGKRTVEDKLKEVLLLLQSEDDVGYGVHTIRWGDVTLTRICQVRNSIVIEVKRGDRNVGQLAIGLRHMRVAR